MTIVTLLGCPAYNDSEREVQAVTKFIATGGHLTSPGT
jgi:hypothetical protein